MLYRNQVICGKLFLSVATVMMHPTPFGEELRPLDELARLFASADYDPQVAQLINQARQRVATSLANYAATVASLQQQLDQVTWHQQQHPSAVDNEVLAARQGGRQERRHPQEALPTGEGHPRPLAEGSPNGACCGENGSLQASSYQQQVEQALRKSEEKYRTLIETTATGYAITDDTGLILEANAEYIRLVGRRRTDEVVGHYPWEWTAPHDRERNQAAFANLLEVGTLRNFEVDYITLTGALMPVEINATVLQTDEGVRVMALLRDIRTRKKAAAALAESELRFRQLAEHVDGVFWLTEANPDRLLYVSPAYERYWGRPAATLFVDPWDWLHSIHPGDRQRVYEAIIAKQLQGEYDEEYRLIQPNGAVRWVRDRSFPVADQEGRIYRIAGLTEDITQRKEAAEALRTSEERFRQLAENINEAFWLVDDSGVLYVSPAYERIWGRSAASYYAAPWQWLKSVHADDRERIERAVLEKQAAGTYDEEYRILRPDGTMRWIRDRAFPIRDEQGAVVRIAGLAEDITQKKRQEEALQLLLDCSRVTGHAFFATLVETLAQVLGVHHILLWEVLGEAPHRARLVAAWPEPSEPDSAPWLFGQSPCTLAAFERITLIESGAQQRFPADPLLRHYQAESFLGTPLRSSAGATIGLLLVLDDNSLAEDGNPVALLEIFAGRAAAELERERAEAEIKKLNAELEQRVLERTAELAAANQALRISEQRLRQIIDLVPHRIFAKDMTGRYILANQAEAEHHGATVEALLGKSPVEFGIPPEIVADFLQSDLALIESGQPRAVHLQRIPDRQGITQVLHTTIMPFNLSGADAPAIVGISIDITEQQRIEEELRQSEARQRALLAAVPDMVFRISRDGLFRDFSAPEGIGLLLPREQIIGARVCDLPLPGAVIEASLAAYEQAIATGKMQTLEYAIATPAGQQFFESRIVRSGSDEIVSIVRDITQRKAAEAEIYRLNEELEQRVRQRTVELEAANRELESFSYSVSHDLRAPLRAINGFSQALAEDYGDRLDRDGLDYLERVRAASQRMAMLIDDLLTLSRVTRQEMRRTPLNLTHLATAIATELQASQPKRQVRFTIAPEMWVTGDPSLLRIVLDNLLHNAWKYTSKHAQAHIEVGRVDQPGGPVYFVRDDGAGFEMAYVDRLFGAFQRLHRDSEFEGTGIGLATVQRIIHRHGGRTWAEGEVEQGATFYFTLPDGAKPHDPDD